MVSFQLEKNIVIKDKYKLVLPANNTLSRPAIHHDLKAQLLFFQLFSPLFNCEDAIITRVCNQKRNVVFLRSTLLCELAKSVENHKLKLLKQLAWFNPSINRNFSMWVLKPQLCADYK